MDIVRETTRNPKVFILIVAVIGGLSGCRTVRPTTGHDGPRLENLLRQSLAEEFTPGREIVVSYVEIPPHTTMDRHWYPL